MFWTMLVAVLITLPMMVALWALAIDISKEVYEERFKKK